MAIVDRMSNPRTATQEIARVLTKVFADREAAEHDAQQPPDRAEKLERNAMSYGDPASVRRLTKVVAGAVAQSANVIGITGARSGVGVSITSRELAGAFAAYGKRTLLVDLSHAETADAAPAATSAAPISFVDLAREVRPSLAVVDLSAAADPLVLTPDALRGALAEATQQGIVTVIDLPPVMQQSGEPTSSIAAFGKACDLVFLLCLSGETKRSELTACVETCRIAGLSLGGLILNDWRLPASGLLES